MPEATDPDMTYAVRLRGITKYFPGVTALRRVDLDILAGEVHGLVGENGAGKSTLIKHISGVYRPDEGSVEIFGREYGLADPRARQQAGVGIVYQERAIVPELSAASNVFLGKSISWGPFISARGTRRRFNELADRLGADIEAGAVAGALSVGNQQLLEIMRALDADHRILVLDEPTTALGAPERQRLYGIVGDLRRQGLTVIYISHDLDEVIGLCDRVSVMRDGELVASKPTAQWRKQSLVDAMLGGAELRKSVSRAPPASETALELEGLAIPGIVEDLSFKLRKGEILGIAGLIGSGRTEILRAIAGADRGAEGKMWVGGVAQPLPRSIAQGLGYGIALAPEDRKNQGLVLSLGGSDNVTLSNLKAVADHGIIDPQKRRQLAASVMRELAFNVNRLDVPARNLSGGNQQKLVLGKWLYRKPDVLLLDEPTQGIDIGAKAEVFDVIAKIANDGTSVIFVSSEFEEVIDISDRILVVGRGRILGVLERAEASVKAILDLLFGVEIAA